MGCPLAISGAVIVGNCKEPALSGKATFEDADVTVTGAERTSLGTVSVGEVAAAVGSVGWISVLV
jgi:hypothetical protein